jgi:hypothetical protein
MKRFWTMLLVVAMALVMALPAGAKPDKPDKPGKPPPDEPLAGLTCEEANPPPMSAGRTTKVCIDENDENCGTFTLTLEPKFDTCIDVMSVAGDWEIKVIDMGSANEISLAVQDSVAPGDACWGGCAGEEIVTSTGETYFHWTEASTVDACGIDFGDEDERLTFHAEARFPRPWKNIVPATIMVTLPSES